MKYSKICKHCGTPFETNNPQKIYCNNQHYRPCPICGTPVKMIDNDFSRPPKCCSSECAHKLRQTKFKPRKCVFCGEMFVPKSGVQIACDKVHTDNCEICGKPFIRTVSNMNDRVTTCSKECTAEKVRRNNLEKYGAEHPMQSKIGQQHFHEAMKAKYGVAHALQIPGKIAQQQVAAYETNMKHSGVPYACLTPGCMASNRDRISKINQRFAKRLESEGIHCEFEKVIDRKSYDIFIPEQRIVIEIDPTYTHSAKENHYGTAMDRYYHRDKTYLAESEGYRCIHVFDWDNWTPIVNMLLPKKRVFARKCTIYRLNKNVGDEFLQSYHIQGTCRGQLLYLGLVYEGELLQVMTFGKSRFDKNYDVELLRLCTKPGVVVVGGASKLFSYATDEYGLSKIISYCDRAKFNGDVYTRIGMQLKRITPPQEIWSKSTNHITANLLRARGYDQLFGTNYGKGTSNEALMLQDGWLPIFDCGQKVFVYE